MKKRCDYCRKKIAARATRCPHCQSFLQVQNRPAPTIPPPKEDNDIVDGAVHYTAPIITPAAGFPADDVPVQSPSAVSPGAGTSAKNRRTVLIVVIAAFALLAAVITAFCLINRGTGTEEDAAEPHVTLSTNGLLRPAEDIPDAPTTAEEESTTVPETTAMPTTAAPTTAAPLPTSDAKAEPTDATTRNVSPVGSAPTTEGTMRIILRPQHSVSTLAKSADAALIRDRLRVMYPSGNYQCTLSGGDLLLTVPDTIPADAVEDTLVYCIARPGRVYLINYGILHPGTSQFISVPLTASDITDFTFLRQSDTEYLFPHGEGDYYKLSYVSFTERFRQENEAYFTNDASSMILFDCEEYPNDSAGYYLYKEDSSLYLGTEAPFYYDDSALVYHVLTHANLNTGYTVVMP